MKIKLTDHQFINQYDFVVDFNNTAYNVTVYLNEKGKFIDEIVRLNSVELWDGELRDEIVEGLNREWDNLV